MKKKLLLIFCLLPVLSMAVTVPDSTKKVSAIATGSFRHHLSLQLEGGSQGVGTDLRYGATPGISLRLGASFIPVTANNALSLPGFQSINNINVSFYNVHLLADFVPFKKMRGLRFVTGGAYLYKANGNLNVIPLGSYTYGSTTVTGT